MECLRLTKSAASTSRKAFWLLKSVNHVHTVIDLIEHYSLANDEGYANFLDILEQLCLIVYYWYENLVFLARTKLVSFTEQSMDGWGNMCWFAEDFTCFLAALVRTVLCSRKIMEKQGRIRNSSFAVPEIKYNNEGGGVFSLQIHQEADRSMRKELSLLRRSYSDSLLTLAIVGVVSIYNTVYELTSFDVCLILLLSA